MASGLTTPTTYAVLRHVLGIASMPMPSELHLALSTTTPGSGGTNFTEPTAGSYARLAVATSDFDVTEGNPSLATNVEVLGWPDLTESWGTIVYAGLFTAATGGAPFAIGSTPEMETGTSDTIRFLVNQLEVTVGSA